MIISDLKKINYKNHLSLNVGGICMIIKLKLNHKKNITICNV